MTVEVFPLGERDRVDQDVEIALPGVPALEYLLDLFIVADVAAFDEGRPDRRGERADAPLDERSHRAESNLGALVVESLGDSPGDRVVVCDTEHERLLALEQSIPIAVVDRPGQAAANSRLRAGRGDFDGRGHGPG